MHEEEFIRVAQEIVQGDDRYHVDSYTFIREALEYTAKLLERPAGEGGARHVSASELLEGIRSYALEMFGPMALTVLKSWNVTRTEHIGDIVFNLVNAGVLRKTDSDSPKDFANGFDFEAAFAKPYIPSGKE